MQSRVFGGIHWQFDHVAVLKADAAMADQTFDIHLLESGGYTRSTYEISSPQDLIVIVGEPVQSRLAPISITMRHHMRVVVFSATSSIVCTRSLARKRTDDSNTIQTMRVNCSAVFSQLTMSLKRFHRIWPALLNRSGVPLMPAHRVSRRAEIMEDKWKLSSEHFLAMHKEDLA